MQPVIVAQTIEGGRAPAQLSSWRGRLLDHPLAPAGIRVLLAAVVAAVGAIVAGLGRTGPTPISASA